MLKLLIMGEEFFNEEDQTFTSVNDQTLTLEHSLISLSKWESIHKIPFLTSKDRTEQQMLDYLKCMIIGDESDEEKIYLLSSDHFNKINDYIKSTESATTFGNLPNKGGSSETITAELIYYWMIAFNIPMECENWHLNRLLALIRVCNIKQQKPKKMSRSEIAQRNAKLNAERRAKYGSSG